MKISEPYLFTGISSQELEVEVYIIDEVNDRELYVKTIKVKSKVATFQLRQDKKQLKDVFENVVRQLTEQDNVKKISGIVNIARLELVGDFEQRGNYFTLRLKVKS